MGTHFILCILFILFILSDDVFCKPLPDSKLIRTNSARDVMENKRGSWIPYKCFASLRLVKIYSFPSQPVMPVERAVLDYFRDIVQQAEFNCQDTRTMYRGNMLSECGGRTPLLFDASRRALQKRPDLPWRIPKKTGGRGSGT